MKMIKNINLKLMLMLVLIGVFCVNAYSAVSDMNDLVHLDVNLLNQNPDPAYAGDIVEITLSLKNAGYGVMNLDQNTYFRIEDMYPFTVISESYIQLGNVYSDSSYLSTKKIKLQIDSNAKSGNYELIVKEVRGNIVYEHKIPVSIASDNNIDVISIDKNSIKPGAIDEITFTIKNVGSSDLQNIEFEWENDNAVLLPVNGDNRMFVERLNIGEQKNVTFAISASSAVSADLYKLKLSIIYKNHKTSETNKETSIAGIYVGGDTEFDLTYDEQSGTDYIFTVSNIGANDATAVRVFIDNSSTWIANGKSSEMIGNLNKGDYTTFSFVFDKTSSSDLLLRIDYTDTSGNRISEYKKIKMNTKSQEVGGYLQNQSSLRSSTQQITGNTRNNNPMSGLQTGMSTLKKWFTYTVYLLIGSVVLLVTYRVTKKIIRKKKLKNQN